MRDSQVTFIADGIHVWVKIGAHCRALLSPPAETELRTWLDKRAMSELGIESPPSTKLELPASRVDQTWTQSS